MNLAELADIVCKKIGKTDDESVEFAKTCLRQRHELIYDSALWKDTIIHLSVSATADVEHVVLPYDVARPLAVWDETSNLPVDISSLTRTAMVNPARMTEVGGLMTFAEVDSVGWIRELTAETQIGFINPNLVEVRINVSGTRNFGIWTYPDVVDSEVLVVPASGGPVLSSAWKEITRMTKPQTDHAIYVGEAGSDVTWLWPAESSEAVFCRIRLMPPPQSATTLGILGKRRLRQMRSDTDQPMIRGIDNVLLAYAQADMLERSRQYGKAAAKNQEGTGLLAVAKDGEVNQSASDFRIVPEVYAEQGLDY